IRAASVPGPAVCDTVRAIVAPPRRITMARAERCIAANQPRDPGRRAFVRGAAGLAGILAAWPAPATCAAREISLLPATNYAPDSDGKLAELAKKFAKASGVNVRVDHMQSVQMSGKLSAELMSKGGHDVVSLEMHYPYLFAPGLADVSDLCNDLAKKHGDWYQFAKEHALVKGQWLGVPFMYTSFPGSHRIDLFEKVGAKAPDTSADLLRAC